MRKSLAIAVRIHDGRYHGEGDGFDDASWPPSPARLFQSLVAGAAHGGTVHADDQRALRWLEELPPPRIAAPTSRPGGLLPAFVPSNDLDAKLGGRAKATKIEDTVSRIRDAKSWRPRLFVASVPIIYVWEFEPPDAQAHRLCDIAARLYQLGRGIDMAAATGQIMACGEADAALNDHPGSVWRPSGGGAVGVPAPGSTTSLIERHEGRYRQLAREGDGAMLFTQPPKAFFRHIGYATPPRRLHFDLLDADGFAPRPLRCAALTVRDIRDAVGGRLRDTLADQAGQVERLVIGRNAGPQDIAQRIRILPVPSVGMEHTDPSIRRVAVEIPRACPVDWRDLRWAFAGLVPFDSKTGAPWSSRLVTSGEGTMLERYARPARLFRSVTAVALTHARRAPAGGATLRREDESRAVKAVFQALRHAGIRTKPTSVSVQREPLHQRGSRAEAFAEGSRFSPQAMWHVELEFPAEVAGPLVLGDGRFAGLGLMEPVVRGHCDFFALRLEPGLRVPRADSAALLRSVRRALMALARDDRGRVSRLFSGHEADGRPDRSQHHGHIFITADGGEHGQLDWIARILVAAPWRADRTKTPRDSARREFDRTVRALNDLRAGSVGRFHLAAVQLAEGDPVTGPGTTWESVTPYLATRHAKSKSEARVAILKDVYSECARRGLPDPARVGFSEISVGPKGGSPSASLTLHFAAAVRGPLLLGRNSHAGGGLFHVVPTGADRSAASREQAWKDLRATMDEIGKKASRRGLTDAELERLLTDGS